MQLSELPKITAKPAIHRNKRVLKLCFADYNEIIEYVRTFPGVLWSFSMKCWYVPETPDIVEFLQRFKKIIVEFEKGEVSVK